MAKLYSLFEEVLFVCLLVFVVLFSLCPNSVFQGLSEVGLRVPIWDQELSKAIV